MASHRNSIIILSRILFLGFVLSYHVTSVFANTKPIVFHGREDIKEYVCSTQNVHSGFRFLLVIFASLSYRYSSDSCTAETLLDQNPMDIKDCYNHLGVESFSPTHGSSSNWCLSLYDMISVMLASPPNTKMLGTCHGPSLKEFNPV